ncbi:ribulose-phosphate 3-epimerase [Humidisolicoccus flavus]|uniref:ribulose-phosphate 3-epimerase n=1 Tax=Humidisolicoccus flavus TaxID=3111414 RepID=UPI00324A1F51
MIRIHPSILSADFANLERELTSIASADAVHVDVMDGHFVPNLTLGLPVVKRLAEVSPLDLDVHLMITDVDEWAPQYADAGAQSVTFHAEATQDPVSLARELRARGARASIALKPATTVDSILDRLHEFDQVLVMTVEPGFGGQAFMPDMMPKLVALRAAANDQGVDLRLQVDGGITVDTIGTAVEAGADTFVAGSSVFQDDERERNIATLREAGIAACGHASTAAGGIIDSATTGTLSE